MESEYFHSNMYKPVRLPSKDIEDNIELERETFLALQDRIGDTPLFIEMCYKSQNLTHLQRLMLEEIEIDDYVHGESR